MIKFQPCFCQLLSRSAGFRCSGLIESPTQNICMICFNYSISQHSPHHFNLHFLFLFLFVLFSYMSSNSVSPFCDIPFLLLFRFGPIRNFLCFCVRVCPRLQKFCCYCCLELRLYPPFFCPPPLPLPPPPSSSLFVSLRFLCLIFTCPDFSMSFHPTSLLRLWVLIFHMPFFLTRLDFFHSSPSQLWLQHGGRRRACRRGEIRGPRCGRGRVSRGSGGARRCGRQRGLHQPRRAVAAHLLPLHAMR